MKRWATRALITLVLAAVAHFALVLFIPYGVAAILARGILARTAVNTFAHGNPTMAGPEDRIPQGNPDILPSIMVYDVRERPLKLHLAVPDSIPYWSISLFASNLDNYYVLNDRAVRDLAPESGTREVDLVLVGPTSDYHPQGKEMVVVSPSNRGFALIRMTLADRYSEAGRIEVEKLKRIQAMSRAEPMR